MAEEEKKPLSLRFDGERTIMVLAVAAVIFFGGRLMMKQDEIDRRFNETVNPEFARLATKDALMDQRVTNLEDKVSSRLVDLTRAMEALQSEVRSIRNSRGESR